MKNSRLLFTAIFLIVPSCILLGQDTVAQAAQANVPDLSKLIAEGNEFSQKSFDNQKALDKFLEAYAVAPSNDEVLWRLSRTYVDIGEHLPSSTDEEKQKQLEIYEKSLECANKAVAANPKSSMALTRRAIANGRIALFRGVWESLDLVKQTRADCEKALELDAANPAAYYVLGRTHMKVSEKPRIIRWPLGLSWANLEDAVKNYEKAISLRPDFIMYHIDCARAFVELDEYVKAREHLNLIATLPTQDEDDDQFRKEAKELLEKITEK